MVVSMLTLWVGVSLADFMPVGKSAMLANQIATEIRSFQSSVEPIYLLLDTAKSLMEKAVLHLLISQT